MTARPVPPPAPLPPLEPLLAPIAEDAPSGHSLRLDAVYDEIRRLREQDDPTLPQGVWQRELKRADWPGVAALAYEALETRSKDLQVAAWLTEAWMKLHAFAGLGHGVTLLGALCGAFWETLHPPIDDGDSDARIAPLAWLASDRFLFAVKSIPITAPVSEDALPVVWSEWEKLRNQPEQTRALTSASLTPEPYLAALAHDLAATVDAVDALKAILLTHLGEHDAPTFSPLRNTLTAIAQFVARVRKDRPETEEVSGMETVPPSSSAADTAAQSELPQALPASGGVASRADAYQRLREASDFLLRTEPHSPVPYLVRRAISWGNMSLAEVLEQLLQKGSDLATIYALLGINPTDKGKGR